MIQCIYLNFYKNYKSIHILDFFIIIYKFNPFITKMTSLLDKQIAQLRKG